MSRTLIARQVGIRILLVLSLVAAGLLGGHALTQEASAEIAPVNAASSVGVEVGIAPPAPPPRPTITADLAWERIETDLSYSPWLRNADEFAQWVDTTGNHCQTYTAEIAEKLRALDYLLNEHWIGRRATKVLLAGAGTVATLVPEPGVMAGAGTLMWVVKTSPEWTDALALRADAVGVWIENTTEVWEDYAKAYRLASESPSAAHIAGWMEASQMLLPYLKRGQELVAVLNEHLGTIDGHLSDLAEYLEGMDHWTVRWLADETHRHAVGPALDTVRGLRPKLQVTQGRLMIDRALITTMPLRFTHIEIVDEMLDAE